MSAFYSSYLYQKGIRTAPELWATTFSRVCVEIQDIMTKKTSLLVSAILLTKCNAGGLIGFVDPDSQTFDLKADLETDTA